MKMQHKSRAGGAMAPKFLKPGESKTARPAKAKVMAKPTETAKRMLEKTGKRGGKF